MRYIELKEQLKTLSNCKVISIGKTILGKELYVICIKGTTTSSVIIQCAMHAREHITCDLIINLLNKYNGEFIPNIYIIPLVNPDGVEICESGRYNYKANSRGVDINNNFNAKWNSLSYYSAYPCESGYAGKECESESETQALVKITKIIQP
ncbi:MAG: M14 family zinc carboxypeptidase, partial [Clostridia bacterium]